MYKMFWIRPFSASVNLPLKLSLHMNENFLTCNTIRLNPTSNRHPSPIVEGGGRKVGGAEVTLGAPSLTAAQHRNDSALK